MAKVRLIDIRQEILSDNRDLAQEIRERLAVERTFLLNLMSSPGSGKTSLILRTIEELRDEFRIGVVEADIDSTVDSEKVAARGVRVVQIRTGGFCHVEAPMVEKALQSMNLASLDLIILENVGNLVCPAESDTGAIANAVILSVPEGDDKPLKYPLIFTVCDVLVLNKVDYPDYGDFDVQALRQRVHCLNPNMHVLEVSCKTGQGLGDWISWIRNEVKAFVGR